MFHVVESSLDSVFQRPFVIGNESVSKAPFFLQGGSAAMLALCSGKSGLYGLAQFCIDDILGLLRPLCFLVESLRDTGLNKAFNDGFDAFTNIRNLYGAKANPAKCHRTFGQSVVIADIVQRTHQ